MTDRVVELALATLFVALGVAGLVMLALNV
jgi:hypothetical protein